MFLWNLYYEGNLKFWFRYIKGFHCTTFLARQPLPEKVSLFLAHVCILHIAFQIKLHNYCESFNFIEYRFRILMAETFISERPHRNWSKKSGIIRCFSFNIFANCIKAQTINSFSVKYIQLVLKQIILILNCGVSKLRMIHKTLYYLKICIYKNMFYLYKTDGCLKI